MRINGGNKWLLLILSLQILLSAFFVFNRVADADEGFYLAASQRTSIELLPKVDAESSPPMLIYRDFFFPQMPLLPLTFSLLSQWGITSLLLLRIIAAAASLLMTIILYNLVRTETENSAAAVGAAFLFAFCGITLTWHTVFKPYAFVDLFLLLASLSLIQVVSASKRVPHALFFAMFFLSLAINFRSIFILLLPVFLFLIQKYAQPTNRLSLSSLPNIIAGLLLPAIPTLIILLKSGSSFWFNNLIFHLHREPITPFSALLLHKVTVIGKFLILPQSIVLIGLALGSLAILKSGLVKNRPLYHVGAILAIAIGVIYLMPTPIHLQYFQQTIPYLIIAAVPTLIFLTKTTQLKPLRFMGGVLYLVGMLPFLVLFIFSPRQKDKRFEWPHLRTVVEQIRQNSLETDTLLSEWAGYAALSGRPQLPGSEHVGFYFPLKVDSSLYRENHLLFNSDIVDALAQRRPKLVVIDYKVNAVWLETLQENYHLTFSSGETFIYKKNSDET